MNIQKVVNAGDGYKFPKLCYPIEWFDKNEILTNLQKQDDDIFKLFWTCENPNGKKQCGKCHPCEVMIEAQNKIYRK